MEREKGFPPSSTVGVGIERGGQIGEQKREKEAGPTVTEYEAAVAYATTPHTHEFPFEQQPHICSIWTPTLTHPLTGDESMSL